MSNDLSPLSPERFGLSSFSELLPARDPIIGEDPGSFTGFHEGMTVSLAPMTPYEAVVAENLIAIEWELLQHRRMREACLRKDIHEAVRKAVVAQKRAEHNAALDAAWEEHTSKGGGEDDWKEPFKFDAETAQRLGDDLAERAISPDPGTQTEAYTEIQGLGLAPIDLMSEAYRVFNRPTNRHDDKVQELERRRRDVRRDYDALQRVRPIEGALIEG